MGGRLVREIERAARIVRFWRTVEMFSPQSVPKSSPRLPENARQGVLDLAPDERAPWEPGHPVAARSLKPPWTWQFTVRVIQPVK
jgi:hypothetical protein